MSSARQWAQIIADAGRDADDSALRQWGQRLQDCVCDDLTEYLTCPINSAQLDKITLVIVLGERGDRYLQAGRKDEALADFGRAIELNPNDAWAHMSRAGIYRLMGQEDEAKADYSRARKLTLGTPGTSPTAAILPTDGTV